MTGETVLRRSRPDIILTPDDRRGMVADGVIDQGEFSALLRGRTTFDAPDPIPVIPTPNILQAYRNLSTSLSAEAPGDNRAIMEQLKRDLNIAGVTGSGGNTAAFGFSPGRALELMRGVVTESPIRR